MSHDFAFLNQQGFIPGPQETEESFYARVDFCQDLLKHLTHEANAELPFEANDLASKNSLDEAFSLTDALYGIAPKWVPLFFSNYQLTPWHGGCAWIFQLNEHTPDAAFLQLRNHFRDSPSYLGIYQRKELIAHELAHVGRLMLHSPQFEEYFAYQTSTHAWRRWLGPIVQSSTESLLFILLLGFILIADLAILGSGNYSFIQANNWLKLLPLFLILLAFIRLTIRHFTLRRCLKQLKGLTSWPYHLLYRLDDQEIKQFARWTPSEIKKFIENASQKAFRWQFLKKLYLY